MFVLEKMHKWVLWSQLSTKVILAIQKKKEKKNVEKMYNAKGTERQKNVISLFIHQQLTIVLFCFYAAPQQM